MKNVSITIPADLLERVKEIPGAAGMTDSQLVSTCLEAGLATAEKEETTAARSTLVKILSALSDEALVYVWRPIMYPTSGPTATATIGSQMMICAAFTFPVWPPTARPKSWSSWTSGGGPWSGAR